MRYTGLLLILMLTACGKPVVKYYRVYNNVEEVGKKYLAKLSPSDTAIVYLKGCSGCMMGTMQTAYLLKKRGLSTIISCTTNYFKTKSKDTLFCWECIIPDFQKASDEKYVHPFRKVIEDGKEYIVADFVDHGHFSTVTFHLGSTVTTFEMTPGGGVTPVQKALMDTLDHYLQPFKWKVTKRKLTRKEPR